MQIVFVCTYIYMCEYVYCDLLTNEQLKNALSSQFKKRGGGDKCSFLTRLAKTFQMSYNL